MICIKQICNGKGMPTALIGPVIPPYQAAHHYEFSIIILEIHIILQCYENSVRTNG